MKILDPSLIYVHHQELRIYSWCHVERETNNGSGWEVHGEINGKSEEIEMDRKREEGWEKLEILGLGMSGAEPNLIWELTFCAF